MKLRFLQCGGVRVMIFNVSFVYVRVSTSVCERVCVYVWFLHSNGDDRMTYLKETLALALTSLYWRFLRIPFSFFSALAGLFCLSFDLP